MRFWIRSALYSVMFVLCCVLYVARSIAQLPPLHRAKTSGNSQQKADRPLSDLAGYAQKTKPTNYTISQSHTAPQPIDPAYISSSLDDPLDAGTSEEYTVPDDSAPPELPDDTAPTDDAASPEQTHLPDDTEPTDDTAPPEQTHLPDDTATPEQTHLPDDTATPEQTHLPDDTATPEQTHLPDDIATPEQTHLPDDTATPEQTHLPDDAAPPEQPPNQCKPACASGFRCIEGRCIEASCYTDGCAEAQICRDRMCISDPCHTFECPYNHYCRDGQCIRSCGQIRCGPKQMCRDGVCIDDPCAEMTCSDGQICCPAAIDCQTAGACIPDPCTRVECPYGKLCHPLTGQCIDDPCRDIRCPHPEERCELGQCLPPPPEPDEHPKSESIDPEQTPESGSSESLNESTHTETPPIPDAQNQEISSEYKSSEHTENTEHITGSDQTGNQPDHISEGCGCASTSNIPYSLLFALILLCLTLPRKNLSRSQ